MSTYAVRYRKTAWVFIFPQLLITLIFFIWPALRAVFQSFMYSDAFGLSQHWAGLHNYLDLFSSVEYGTAIRVTLILALSITVLTLGLGLLLAVILDHIQRGKSVYKTLLLWPYAVAPAVAAILWRFLCHPTLGWVTGFLSSLGIHFNNTINPWHALIVIVLTASWQQFSYNFLFYLAALSRIPRGIREAALLDCASAWHRFWHILFPLLSPTTFFLIVMNLMYAFFDTFGIIDAITHGGPGYATTSLVYKVYEDGFVGMDPGSSSAQSVLLMLMVTVIMLIQFRLIDKKVHYE
jgi:sn-glycerol 3-phosphate transport system permease protein